MFYRQKILLSLVEVLETNITSTDFQKLLFLYCQEMEQSHYSFFPYKFGAFSFMSYYDKRKLIENCYLRDQKNFELASKNLHIEKLKIKDRQSIISFAQRTKNLRGRKLVRKTYLDYPKFASRSRIIADVLTGDELKKIRGDWNIDDSPSLFSIGYEGKTIDDYLRALIFNNVKILVDVRNNPFSRKHGFSKKDLENYVTRAGVEYLHLPTLGVPSTLRKNLSDDQSYTNLFELYAEKILPRNVEALDEIKSLILTRKRVALTCFEIDHLKCHRHKIVNRLGEDSEYKFSINHI